MTTVQTAAYGSWKSPLTAGQIATSTIRLTETQLDETDIYLVRDAAPRRGADTSLWRCDAKGQITEMNPAPFNAPHPRSRVRGRSLHCLQGGGLFF